MTAVAPSLMRPRALSLLERLAAERRVGMFVGAGISAEAGLPSWTELVRRVLEQVAPETESFRDHFAALRPGTEEDTRERSVGTFANLTVRSLGVLGGAAVAKRHLGEEYLPAVSRALYDDVSPEILAPGPTALAIARFTISTAPEDRAVILTTNYDRLLEMAFVSELERLDLPVTGVVSLLPGDPLDAGEFVIVHLHGLIDERSRPGERAQGRIVFAEDEYLAPGKEGEARRLLVEDLLRETTYLFVGTSLTDPNVLSYLYRSSATGDTKPHAAVAVAQSAAAEADDAPQFVVDALQDASAKRLRSAGVDVVFLDTYSEASQFVRELELQRALLRGPDPSDYETSPWRWDHRARELEQCALRGGLLPAAGAEGRFVELQPRWREALAVALAETQRLLADNPALHAADEQLALHLWLHSPSTRRLVLVAQSDRLSFNPATLQATKAALPTSYLVAEAFCNGTTVEARDPALRSSRWGSMLAVPVTCSEAIEGVDASAALAAGVLVLASTRAGEAGLARLGARPQDRTRLVSALSAFGSSLITKATDAAPEPDPARGVDLEPLVDIGPRRADGDAQPSTQRVGPGTHITGAPPERGVDLGPWEAVAAAAHR